MNRIRTRLAIDDFILEMMRSPIDRLQLSQLQDWVADLDLKEELFKQHIAFCHRGYRRTLVCRTSRFDMLILCWQPGQSSTIHDHADSLNVTRVYQGHLTSRVFQSPPKRSPFQDRCPLNAADSGMSLVQMQEEHLHRNALASVDRHQMHQLANTADENLVTLHVYARPLQDIHVYCPQTQQVSRMAVQYDLAAS